VSCATSKNGPLLHCAYKCCFASPPPDNGRRFSFSLTPNFSWVCDVRAYRKNRFQRFLSFHVFRIFRGDLFSPVLHSLRRRMISAVRPTPPVSPHLPWFSPPMKVPKVRPRIAQRQRRVREQPPWVNRPIRISSPEGAADQRFRSAHSRKITIISSSLKGPPFPLKTFCSTLQMSQFSPSVSAFSRTP